MRLHLGNDHVELQILDLLFLLGYYPVLFQKDHVLLQDFIAQLAFHVRNAYIVVDEDEDKRDRHSDIKQSEIRLEDDLENDHRSRDGNIQQETDDLPYYQPFRADYYLKDHKRIKDCGKNDSHPEIAFSVIDIILIDVIVHMSILRGNDTVQSR